MNNENIQHTINATEGERQLSIVGNNFKETDEVAKDGELKIPQKVYFIRRKHRHESYDDDVYIYVDDFGDCDEKSILDTIFKDDDIKKRTFYVHTIFNAPYPMKIGLLYPMY